jgi:glycosyltransferase involved in cell wall biosynthesis
MYNLTIVIATHNRPSLVVEAIESVLKQGFRDFYFVLSDNSDNNDTLVQLQALSLVDRLYYIKRPNITHLEHFNIILDETKTKYLILFHDDDVMLPDMVGTLYKEMLSDDDTMVAIGCNAYFQKGNKYLVKSLGIKKDLLLSSKIDLIERYYDNRIVVFPSYIYNLDLIKKYNVCFTNKAGKYSDVIWLLEIMNCGKIKWLDKKLMIYRLHRGQDSAKTDIRAKQQLVNYYSAALGKGKECKTIKNWRILNLYYLMLSRLERNNRMTFFLFRQLLLIIKNQNGVIRKCLLKYGIYIINVYFLKLFHIDILFFLEKYLSYNNKAGI